MSDTLTVVDVLKLLLACVAIGCFAGWALGQLERLAGWRRR